MTLEQMQAQLRLFIARLKELRAKTTGLTPEEIEERKGLPTKMEELNSNIEEELRAQKILTDLDEPIVQPPSGETPEARAQVMDKPVYRTFGAQIHDIIAAGGQDISGVDVNEARGRILENEKRQKEIFGLERRSDTVSVTDPATGGALVQTDFAMDIVEKGFNNGVVVSKCSQRMLTGGANSLEIHGIDENSREDGARFGGIRVYTKREMEQYDPSKTKFAMVSYKVDKITGLLKLSDEIMQDAGFLETEISSLFPKAFDFKVQDLIFSSGTGAGEPQSIMNSKAMLVIAKETDQAAKTITPMNISKMKAAASGNAEFYGNRDIIPVLDELYRVPAEGGTAVKMFKSTSINTGILDGIPITFIEQAETLGSQGDLVLADFGEYLILRKGGINKAESVHFYFDQGIKAIRWDMRLDGKSRWNSPLSPYKGTNKISPFVTLAKRA